MDVNPLAQRPVRSPSRPKKAQQAQQKTKAPRPQSARGSVPRAASLQGPKPAASSQSSPSTRRSGPRSARPTQPPTQPSLGTRDAPDGAMRVQKLLAQQGIASRRKAEELIAQGRVFVNGKRAALGTCACPQKDTISVLGHGLVRPQSQAPQELVLVMNKPKGYLCSHSDPHHSQTIYDLVPSCYQKERLLCAGRLDKESEGLLILSNSGSIIQRLCHPRYGVTKRYSVTLHKPFDPKDVVRFIKGIQDEGEHLAAQAVLTAPFGHDACRIEVHLAQGRKREIRRLCQAFGYYVTQLRRFQIGKFVLKKIPLGAVRKLSVKEVSMLLAPGSAG